MNDPAKPILVRFLIKTSQPGIDGIDRILTAKAWLRVGGKRLQFQRSWRRLRNASATLPDIEAAFKPEAMRRLARKVPGRELVAEGMKPVTCPVPVEKRPEQEVML